MDKVFTLIRPALMSHSDYKLAPHPQPPHRGRFFTKRFTIGLYLVDKEEEARKIKTHEDLVIYQKAFNAAMRIF